MSKLQLLTTLLVGLILNQTYNCAAESVTYSSNKISVNIDKTSGGLQSININGDPFAMNWILKSDSTQYPWQSGKMAWGLGYGTINGNKVAWNKPESIRFKKKTNSIIYRAGDLTIEVKRQFNKSGELTETFVFSNTSVKNISVSEMGIFTPFNDNYPDSKTCIEARCNAHIWTGGSSSYVFAQRMGGDAPHLGIVLTKGALKSYEIMNRSHHVYDWKLSGSNVRGTIVLNPANFVLKPKQEYSIEWVIYPATNWTDFYAKAKQHGFVKATATNYVVEKEEPIEATFESDKPLKNVQCLLNGQEIAFNQNGTKIKIEALPQSSGEQILELKYNNGEKTVLNALKIMDIEGLIKKRAQFIVANQQLNDSTDERNGAYLVYDNELNKIYLNDDARKSSDLNEGRERLGMGIFLAMYLQSHPDAEIKASLMRYYNFVRNKLQRPDYSIRNGLTSNKHRPYNNTWVAHFYLEMYKLTDEGKYLIDYFHTQHKYFETGRYKFYGIDVPIADGLKALKKAGLTKEYDVLLNDARLTAENFIKTSLFYPKSEVNFEQSIVGPSVVLLLEIYQITNEKKYLKEAEVQLKALEAFGGNQPDYHLNDIAIRHWDGYWFGKKQFWGDVFPHYWSAVNAEAFARYAVVTGKKEYMHRAKTIVRNNLCQFFEDGSASCAYLYPAKVNGEKAAFFDPFANDQDFALVYYLRYLQLLNQ